MFTRSLIALTLAAAAAAAALPAQAQTAVPVKTLDIYVDLPTGFAVVKMPAGWKFVGKLEAAQLRELPQTALTSLLAPEADQVRQARPASKGEDGEG